MSVLKHVRALILPLLVGAIVAVAALLVKSGGTGGAGGAAPASVPAGRGGAVAIRNYNFIPAKLTIKAGTKVVFRNRDATAHTATADAGGFDTGTIAPDGSKRVVFSKPGTYSYHCAFHAFMTGTVTVKQL